MGVAFNTTHNIERTLSPTHHQQQSDGYSKRGVYALTCSQCQKRYIGQTGRSFHTHYKEHMQDYRHNYKKSQFAKHLLELNHSPGTLQQTITILHTAKKGRLLNTIERYCILKEAHHDNELNDRATVTPNIIFDTIIRNKTPTAARQ
jgi:hypothetical protein